MGSAEQKVLGNDHLKAGRLESARDCYSRALETCEEPAEVAALHCNRALAELKLGQHTQCVADCDAAIAKQPRYGKAFFRRAQAREALEQLSEAFKDVHELMRFEPENKEAKARPPHTRPRTRPTIPPAVHARTSRGGPDAPAGLRREAQASHGDTGFSGRPLDAFPGCREATGP